MRKLLTAILLAISLVPGTWPQATQQNTTTQSTANGTTSSSTTRHHRTYTNKSGQQVKSPERSATVPVGATAKCADGTYSFSKHRRGTCSHHGGVSQWL